MTVSAAPSVFDIFNARMLTPEQVAKRFVPPPFFGELALPANTVVVGPRGSGKTTVLKMLHPSALPAWKHPRKQAFENLVNYTGVFIGTDITWNEQLQAVGFGLSDTAHRKALATAAFTTHVLSSLLESMAVRSGAVRRGGTIIKAHRPVSLNDDRQAALCRTIASGWKLKDTLPSFAGLRLGLAQRLITIRSSGAPRSLGQEVPVRSLGSDAEILGIDFLSAATYAVEAFNQYCYEPDGKFALLFDELELAPSWLRDMLVRLLRSTDSRLLFKVSVSPYTTSFLT